MAKIDFLDKKWTFGIVCNIAKKEAWEAKNAKASLILLRMRALYYSTEITWSSEAIFE